MAARIAGQVPDTILLLEHTPVITLGVRACLQHVLFSPAILAQRGIDLVKSSRGGDVTWHGPGQLVMYPIIKLGEQEADARGYLYNLEEIAIRTAAAFGVEAFRRSGLTGAWTTEGKLAAIGIRLKRWVTLHGISFNVHPDLSGFAAIIPCGLAGESVTSLQVILKSACPKLDDVKKHLLANFGVVCHRAVRSFPSDQPPAELVRLLAPYLRTERYG